MSENFQTQTKNGHKKHRAHCRWFSSCWADKQQPLLEEHKKELFKYAPVIAAYNRGIQDEAKVVDMAKFAFKQPWTMPNSKVRLLSPTRSISILPISTPTVS